MTFNLDLWRSRHGEPVDRDWLVSGHTLFNRIKPADTRLELKAKIENAFELWIDELTEHLAHDTLATAVKTYLRIPNRNHYTVALADSTISQEEQLDDEAIRHILCFMREIERHAPVLLQGYLDASIVGGPGDRSNRIGKHYLPPTVPNYNTTNWIKQRMDDANAILDLMNAYEDNDTLRHFMEDGEFIRNQYYQHGKATLTTLGNKSFVRLAGKGGSAELPAQTSLMLGDGWTAFSPPTNLLTNQTDGVKVSVDGRPFHINVNADSMTAAVEYTVLDGASRDMTLAELKRGFTVNSIAPPTNTETVLHDQSIAVGVTQSVNVANLFTGRGIAISVGTSNAGVATAQISSGETSIGIVGQSAGTATITVTATNVAGTISRTFDVTVISE